MGPKVVKANWPKGACLRVSGDFQPYPEVLWRPIVRHLNKDAVSQAVAFVSGAGTVADDKQVGLRTAGKQ